MSSCGLVDEIGERDSDFALFGKHTNAQQPQWKETTLFTTLIEVVPCLAFDRRRRLAVGLRTPYIGVGDQFLV